ncbi:MAG TPA: hypothetical protein VF812_07995 [Ktedonobacterales bacterium]
MSTQVVTLYAGLIHALFVTAVGYFVTVYFSAAFDPIVGLFSGMVAGIAAGFFADWFVSVLIDWLVKKQ